MRVLLFIILMHLSAVEAIAAPDYDGLIRRAEQSLQHTETLQARFVQIAWDGSRVSGDFYLKRPGKLRFDYDDPIEDFIVADGTFIFYYDAELEQQSNALIGATLADFILRKEIKLSGDILVTQVKEGTDLYHFTLVQTEDPHAGSITLSFDKKRFGLKKWLIKDAQGLHTEVILEQIKRGVALERGLFYYHDPKYNVIQYNE